MQAQARTRQTIIGIDADGTLVFAVHAFADAHV
jgi:hypothetical protein